MLETLRRLVQEVNQARNLDHALSIIVHSVKAIMDVAVCSVYLRDNSNAFILMATDGLQEKAVGKVRLQEGEGLVSLVASRAEPINLRSALAHRNYHYFPETGEESYHAFLGVPIIHHRKVVGVLVVQDRDAQSFNEESETFLITVAAQLAGAIAHVEIGNDVAGQNETEPATLDSRSITGLPGAAGVAMGVARVVYPLADIAAVPDRQITDIAAELEKFEKALAAVRQELRIMSQRLEDKLPSQEHALFDAYLLMLESDSITDGIRSAIEKGNWAAGALRKVIQEHEQVFQEMEDSYMRERGDDVRDLGRRILMHLQQDAPADTDFSENTILVSEEVTPSMLADMPMDRIIGVVSVRGSRTSHVAILARALGLPTVMGAEDLPVRHIDGREVIVDGYSGRVYLSPSKTVRREYRELLNQEQELSEELQGLKGLPAETLDGEKIHLYVNTGLLADMTPTQESGAEGIGLYRTEFPFMIRQRFPGEDEQRNIYRQVLESFAPDPVVLRTLDVGGDKALPYFPIEEENPFLGWRGIRITLDHPEIFLVQIRAMLRASVGLNNLNILLPMISDVAELTDSLGLIHQAYGELLEDGENIEMPRIGVMIEVPSAVYQAGSLARRVDYLSIGTNDLTQYLLAVDRNNARVAALYDSLHPAVIRAMMQVVESARVYDKPVSVCGEMAGDPAAAILLVGMGIESLSMSVASLPRIKWVIRNLSRERATEILSVVLIMEDVHSIRAYLHEQLEQAGLGGLVRAGK